MIEFMKNSLPSMEYIDGDTDKNATDYEKRREEMKKREKLTKTDTYVLSSSTHIVLYMPHNNE